MALTGRISSADYSVAAEMKAAASANDESLRAIEARLAREKSKLEMLMELRTRGHASWREVAQQKVIVESLQADRNAASHFSAFVAALRERAEWAEHQKDGDSTSDLNCSSNLRIAMLHVAAAQAQTCGELHTAEIAVRREQILVKALELLLAKKFASDRELRSAHQNLQAAESLVERLTSERASRIQSYIELLESSGESIFNDCIAGLEGKEVQPEALPPRFFVRGDFIGRLLELRKNRWDMAARSETIAAQLSLLEELLRRLNKAQHRSAGLEREIELTRLNVEHMQAQQMAASERMTILRLEEIRFSAQCLELPLSENLVMEPRLQSFAKMPTEFKDDSRILFHAGQRVSFATNSPQPAPRDWPMNDWSNRGHLARESTAVSGDRNNRFSEPSYFEYYEFGIRRTDLSPHVKGGFSSGGIPWYLPGSPTNFK